MQDEVLRLWQSRRTTVLLVTHDIDEAIYMADRIAVITPRPGRVERTINVALDRPRQRNSPEFLRLRSEILELLHFTGNAAAETVNGKSFGHNGFLLEPDLADQPFQSKRGLPPLPLER